MPKVATIQLPELKKPEINVTLIGDSPLITHRFSEKARKEMRDKQMGKAKGKKDPKDPYQDFRNASYPMDGNFEEKDFGKAGFGVPVLGFKNAAVTACTSVSGITKVAARQSFFFEGESVLFQEGPFTHRDFLTRILTPEPAVVREDIVRISMGTADLRYRPEYWPWAVNFTIIYNQNTLSEEQIIHLLDVAGFGVGVFEWRPEKNGVYGRFHVAHEDERKEVEKWPA